MQRLPHLASRLQGFGTTIFAEMTALAARHDAVNLGQGFPDFGAPPSVLEAAVAAIQAGHNQYAPGTGLPVLRQAIAAHQQRSWGLTYDPDAEVTVSAGATEAICATLLALCEVGDEVVVFEPAYDSYLASVAMAGAVARPVTLRPPDFGVDLDELRAAVTPKTRALLVNSPHNPTGAVLSHDELAAIAEVCVTHDLLAITDEVYEHLVYDGAHVPLAALPGMRDRTVTISSAAKTFSVTGWKVGWLCAPAPLTAAVRTAKQFMTFTNGTPFQHAVAGALALPDGFFADLRDGYRTRRDKLVAGLAEAGYEVFTPAGSYFVTCRIPPGWELASSPRPAASASRTPSTPRMLGGVAEDDLAFCRALPERLGVAAIPCSAFYVDPRRGRGLVRFAFCKSDAVLDEGIRRLAAGARA